MNTLLLILACISALFAVAVEKQDLLRRKTAPRNFVLSFWILAAVPSYLLFSHYWYYMPLLIFGGLFFILISMAHLGIIKQRSHLSHAGTNALMIIILAAICRADWLFVLYMAVLFFMVYIIMTFVFNKFFIVANNLNHNIIHLLELSQILNGLMIMIIGLIVANGASRFLEKIARLLF